MPLVEATRVTVISLASATERRAAFARQAADGAPPWSYVDAHTAIEPPLRYEARAARRVHGRALSDGELGTWSSHAAVWRRLVDSNDRQAIVLEDDIVADWPFLARLAALDFPAMGIDYLRLFTKIPVRFRKVRSPFLDRYHHLIRITGFALGTQAYLLTRDGARQLLQHAGRIDCPVDAYMDKYWRHGVPNLALYPFPVFERSGASTIGETRFRKPPIPVRDRVALVANRLRERWAMVRSAAGLDPGGMERRLRRRLP